jgi:hypothetical protein
VSENEADGRKKSFWTLPRRDDEILKLKDAGQRQRILQKLRRNRWWSIGALLLYVPLLILLGKSPDPWLLFLYVVFFLDNERRIDQVLVIDLLVRPEAPPRAAALS